MLGAVAWLIRSIIVHWLGKDVESFKNELRIESLEYEHSIASLQAKRAEIIAELYRLLIEFVSSGESYASVIEYSNEPSKDEKGKKFAGDANEFRAYFVKNRIYFPERICDNIDELWSEIVLPMRKFSFWRVRDEFSERTSDAWDVAFKVMSEKVPPIRIQIENEFRIILGVHRKI